MGIWIGSREGVSIPNRWAESMAQDDQDVSCAIDCDSVIQRDDHGMWHATRKAVFHVKGQAVHSYSYDALRGWMVAGGKTCPSCRDELPANVYFETVCVDFTLRQKIMAVCQRVSNLALAIFVIAIVGSPLFLPALHPMFLICFVLPAPIRG